MAGLTLAEAEKITAGAMEKMLEIGASMSVTVVDPRGDPIAMIRMDGTPWRTPAMSRGQALAAACFGPSSGELEEIAMNPVLRAMMVTEGGLMVPGREALAVYRDGELLGAVEAGGSSGEQDEEVAKAGILAAGLTPR